MHSIGFYQNIMARHDAVLAAEASTEVDAQPAELPPQVATPEKGRRERTPPSHRPSMPMNKNGVGYIQNILRMHSI
jgi:hypothetical protein